ncbi:MAG: 50S ribosomal protein L24e [Candidatus Aenigmatarchaeota archaeon]
MPNCSYCKMAIPIGTGKMFVKNDGSIFYFCSRKCEVGMVKMKRNPRKVGWIRKKKTEAKK